MDRLTTVVGKLQDAANTLEGGPSAGSFLQVWDGLFMQRLSAFGTFWDFKIGIQIEF